MNPQNKKKTQRALLWIIFLSFLLLTADGCVYFYFAHPETELPVWERLGEILAMSLQNSAETILFGPVVTIQDVCTAPWYLESPGLRLAMLPYILLQVLIPVLDILLIFSFLDLSLRWLVGLKHKKKNLLVIGDTLQTRALFRRIPGDTKVFFWTDDVLGEEDSRNLNFQGIHTGENLLLYGEAGEKKIRNFFRKNRITHVLLAQNSDQRNIDSYLRLENVQTDRTVQYLVQCEAYENRVLLGNFFDAGLKNQLHPARDLRMFSFPEIQAKKLLKNQPLYLGQRHKSRKKVHLLIIGGGRLGEELLLESMNGGILTQDSELSVDVLDRDTERIRASLTRRFRGGYLKENPEGFSLPDTCADGSFQVRFQEEDIYSQSFRSRILENARNYTCIAVCLPNPEDNLFCAHSLEELLRDSGAELTVAFRTSRSPQAESYFEKMPWCLGVSFLGTGEEAVSLGDLFSREEEQAIRTYNRTYSEAFDTLKPGGEEIEETPDPREEDRIFNGMPYLKRESNRALYAHAQVKKAIFAEQISGSWKRFRDCCRAQKCREEENYSGVFSDLLVSGEFPELLELAKTEHRRFCYFYGSMGWAAPGETQKKQAQQAAVQYLQAHRTEMPADPVQAEIWQKQCIRREKKQWYQQRKLHSCLCTWDELQNGEDRDCMIYDLLSAASIEDSEN